MEETIGMLEELGGELEDGEVWEEENAEETPGGEEAEEVAEPEADKTAPPEAPAAEEEPENLSYRFNHTETLLDKKSVESIASALGMKEDEVIAQLQKGADYDRRVSQHGKVIEDHSDVMNRLEEIAANRGISVKDAQAQLLDALDQTEIFAIMQDIRVKNPEMDPQAIGELAKERHAAQRMSAQLATRRSRESDESRFNDVWTAFFARHPDLANKQLPDEVYGYFVEGFSPEEAYQKHQNDIQAKKTAELEEKLKQLEQAQKNVTTSVGSLSATKTDGNKDDFDEGWDSAFD